MTPRAEVTSSDIVTASSGSPEVCRKPPVAWKVVCSNLSRGCPVRNCRVRGGGGSLCTECNSGQISARAAQVRMPEERAPHLPTQQPRKALGRGTHVVPPSIPNLLICLQEGGQWSVQL